MTELVAKASRAGTYKGTFVIRDKNGNPKFDDPSNVPQKILDVLTEDDKKYLDSLKPEVN